MPFEDVRESARFVEREPRNDWGFSLRDKWYYNEYPTSATSVTLREVAVLDDAADGEPKRTLREVAVLNDRVTPTNRFQRTIREVAVLNDRASPSAHVSHTVRETAALNDDYEYNHSVVVLRDSALLDDALTATLTRSVTVRETAVLNDYAGGRTGLDVREAAVITERTAQTVRQTLTVREVFAADGRAIDTGTTVATLRDTAFFNDYITASMHATQTVREQFWINDTPVPPAAHVAYTADILTMAMTSYTNYPFRSMAGGYGATATGRHLLDQPDDDGSPIVGSITTGMVDFGSAQDKRLEYVYSAGTSESGLTVTVTADRNRVRESYEYQQEFVSTDDTRNSRAKIGKGFFSRAFQFGFSSDAPFYLCEASADTAVSKQRRL